MDDKLRLRLLADRLCYMDKGMDGLRWRHGHQIALAGVGGYWDDYDRRAAELLPTLPVRPQPVVVLCAPHEPVFADGWRQGVLI